MNPPTAAAPSGQFPHNGQPMRSIFSESITALPLANIPLDGATAYLSQADSHQILFMEFAEDVDLLSTAHGAQTGFVFEGASIWSSMARNTPSTKATATTSRRESAIQAGFMPVTPISPSSMNPAATPSQRLQIHGNCDRPAIDPAASSRGAATADFSSDRRRHRGLDRIPPLDRRPRDTNSCCGHLLLSGCTPMRREIVPVALNLHPGEL